MELVEADPFTPRRRKQANRNRNQPEGQVAFPNCRSHGCTPCFRVVRDVLGISRVVTPPARCKIKLRISNEIRKDETYPLLRTLRVRVLACSNSPSSWLVELAFGVLHNGRELACGHIGLTDTLHKCGLGLQHGAVMLLRIKDANRQIQVSSYDSYGLNQI